MVLPDYKAHIPQQAPRATWCYTVLYARTYEDMCTTSSSASLCADRDRQEAWTGSLRGIFACAAQCVLGGILGTFPGHFGVFSESQRDPTRSDRQKSLLTARRGHLPIGMPIGLRRETRMTVDCLER